MKLTRETSDETEILARYKEAIEIIRYLIDYLRSLTFELAPPTLVNDEIIPGLNYIVKYFDDKYHKTIHQRQFICL